MKILTTPQIRELDNYTIEHEPVASIDLMERVAKAITGVIVSRWGTHTPVVVFAGPGNNGGDALAVARLLSERGYAVSVFLFNVQGQLSVDCAVNKQRIVDARRIQSFTEVSKQFDPPPLTAGTLVVDGLFGTGLKRPLAGGFASLVKYINQSAATVVSIDIPSGLMAEDNTYNVNPCIIRADLTLTLQQHKLAFMFSECQPFTGEVKILDIRLSTAFLENLEARFTLLEETDLLPMMRRRGDFEHKGTMGSALVIAGSYGMAGASILATTACLRSGAGKVTVHTPKCNYAIMQTAVPEAVLQLDREETCFSEAVDSSDFDAVAIGPGLGMQETTAMAVLSQIRNNRTPMVIDADAINIIAARKAWLHHLPKHTILTPHVREFERLTNTACKGGYERMCMARDMAEQYELYIVLKGHYSALCTPEGKVFFNSSGNAGMATAGSGDVLTGIIAGLLARGYRQEEACKLGMFLHGLSGDLACRELGEESLIARDLITYLPKAFMRLQD